MKCEMDRSVLGQNAVQWRRYVYVVMMGCMCLKGGQFSTCLIDVCYVLLSMKVVQFHPICLARAVICNPELNFIS
jgi:hypothetical protein